MKVRVSVLVAMAVAAVAGTGCGEELPVWPVHWMCAEAEGIVIGERIGATEVRVENWVLRPGGHLPDVGESMEIASLDDHSRVVQGALLGIGDGKDARILSTQRLVCFLERKGVAWYPLGTVGDGSSGLVWIEKGTCFRYQQPINPGGYVLSRDPSCPSEAGLLEEIAKGMIDRRNWEAALQIRHPQEKAVFLASYLLQRTSPEGDRATYYHKVRQVLPELGIAAVQELMELLRCAQPDDQLDQAVLILNDIGPEAKQAVPLLLPLLDRPGSAHPVTVLEALGRIGDVNVAPRILRFLDHAELPVRAQTASALSAFRYQDAAPDIEKSMPRAVEEHEAYYVYAMLSALKDLDPARAARLAKVYLEAPGMKHVRNLIEPFVQGG